MMYEEVTCSLYDALKDSWGQEIRKIKREISKIEKKIENLKEKEKQNKIKKYWEEHKDEEEKLYAERKELLNNRDELLKAVEGIKEEISNIKKEKNIETPSERRKKNLKLKINEKISQKSKLGIFKFKEKKQIDADIESFTQKIILLENDIKEERTKIEEEAKVNISKLNRSLKEKIRNCR